MATEIIDYKDEAEWLQLRTKDITSTEISALFGLSPYKTAFELFHEKQAGEVFSIADNDRMKWGRRFEAPIAYGVAEDQGWDIEPLKIYMRDTEARIGSSFDFKINSTQDGQGILEIKNVDSLVYRNKWTEEEAPEHIELQIQHQMAVSGLKWCALVAMVGGNSPKIIYREYDEQIGDAIRKKSSAFWQSIADNNPPSADYTRDADALIKIHNSANAGEVLDVTSDVEFATLVQNYQVAGKQIDELEAVRKCYKAKMLEMIGTAEKAVGDWGSITASMTKGTPATIITPDMVGTSYGGRSGFRNFRINIKKVK